jgi:hypothetical protein
MKRPSLPAWVIAAVMVVVLAGGVTVALTRVPARHAEAPVLANGFVGSAACAECHADLAAGHGSGGHNLALRRSSDPAVRKLLPDPQWISDPATGSRYRIAEREGQLGVETEAGGVSVWQPCEWAFGSGTHAVTLVGKAAASGYVEAPLTFYRTAGWDFTPGFLGQPAEQRRGRPSGSPLTEEEALDCFQCHTAGAGMKDEAVDLRGAQLGVQCESCHGPSQAHVSAARQGRPRDGTLLPGSDSGPPVFSLCARCHRDKAPAGLKVTDPVIVRFAPVGLRESRCFQESGGKLSCLSCHNVHAPENTDPDHYRQVCASCHGPKGSKTCPVQPRGNCVSCHMQKRIVQRNAIFTDHWIRIPHPETPKSAVPDRDLHAGL